MVFLSKFLPKLVYPLGLSFFLLLILILVGKLKHWQRTLVIVVLLLVWLGGNPWTAASLTRSLEWRYLPPDEYPSADAIVLLSGGTNPPAFPRQIVEINSAGDRVFYAAYLYHQGKAPFILATGGRLSWAANQESIPAEEMSTILQLLDVPEEAILLEGNSVNTMENAEFSRPILEEQNVKTILLVTSAMHMPRSVYLFEQQGFEVIPAPTDYTLTQNDWENLTHPSWETLLLGLVPDAGSLSETSNALKEYFGMIVYRLLYHN